MSDKVYLPETIASEALPIAGDITIPAASSVQSTGTTKATTAYESPQVQVRPLPQRLIAYATVSESIDTQHKKILGDFTFGEIGAFSVGKYEYGISGDIRITSAGLVARNVNGVITVAIDGTTGNATFLGTIQAGSFIAGDSSVVVEGTSSGGRIVLYEKPSNIPSIILGYV